MFGQCLLLVALAVNSASAQVALGGVCWSTATGVVIGGCASGTQCGPWLPTGGSWDGSSAWYCLALPKLTAGASCDYSNFRGLCATGLSCCSGVCTTGTSCTTTAPTVAPTTAPTTATTTAPTTTAPTTTAPTTTAATTTAACDLAEKVVCGDTSYPSLYAAKCCVSPYICSLITGSTRTSMCQGSDLPVGSTCWTDSVSSGTCASGSICTKTNPTDATGTCQVSTCSGPTTGVSGQNICFNGEAGVSYGTCCPDPNTGNTNVNCFPDISGASTDSFCMAFNIPEGTPCGTTSFTADASCPASAGTKPCSPAGTPCTTTGDIAVPGVTCCNGICPASPTATGPTNCP